MKRTLFHALFCCLCAAFAGAAHAQFSIRDDLNRPLLVKKPAARVVTLAPFLTEILFAIGAGDLAVGVDSLSDYPPEIFPVAKVPTGESLSLERIAALKPDLVLAWKDGIRKEDIDRITAHGTIVFAASARSLEDVSRLMRVVGQLTGRSADTAIARYETAVERLRAENLYKAKLTAFIEIWNRPLTTVSGQHFLTEALEICRAENVFAELRSVAPKVSWEEVTSKDPFLIVSAGSASSYGELRHNWQTRQALGAVKGDRLLLVTDERLTRPSPRTPEGIANLCRQLDEIRAGRLPMQQLAERAPQPAAPGRAPSLGPFVPSLAVPVAPASPRAAAPAAPPSTAAPAEPPAAPAVPVAPAEPPPRRPTQFGM
ncbi:MAG TPA: helical backbone metal receptor [Usitatibacter sp.]|nr:helical backbone metal receptor [Usitatibacter sp.]